MGRCRREKSYEPVAQESASHDDRELLPIVDENDIEVGVARRGDIHRRAWRHRSVHVLVLNSRGQLLLQRRSLMKDVYPGFWDVSVGGHVGVGETYEEAARRETKEELGIESPLRSVGKLNASAPTGWEFVEVYVCRHDGPFLAPPGEIAELQWMDPDDVIERAALERNWPITPSGVHTVRFWRERQIYPDEQASPAQPNGDAP